MDSLDRYFSSKAVTMRRADDADISSLVSVINEAYSYQDAAKGRPRTDFKHLQDRISKTLFYVLEKNDAIVGCVYLEPQEDSLHFGLLTLIPELRGTGVGGKVIDAICVYASKNSYKFIELDYMSLAPWLKKYYQGYGFQETGEITKWGTIDLIKMRMDTPPPNRL